MTTKFPFKLFATCTLFAMHVSCSNEVERQIETVSTEKPFTVQITKERSYFQAQKAQERLLKLDIDAYLVATHGALCFYSSSVLVDSFVLRNPPERKARKRYR